MSFAEFGIAAADSTRQTQKSDRMRLLVISFSILELGGIRLAFSVNLLSSLPELHNPILHALFFPPLL